MLFRKRFLTMGAIALMFLLSSGSLFGQSTGGPTWSVNVGPNAKNWGFVGITKDFVIKDRLSFFVTGGFGTILVGGGAAYYVTSFHESSFVFSSTAGLIGYHADAAYQWKAGRRGFVTTGVSYGFYFLAYKGFAPVLSYEVRF